MEETKPTLEGYEKGQESELGAVNVMTGVYTGRSLIGAIMKQHTPAHSFSFLIIKHKLYRNSSDN